MFSFIKRKKYEKIVKITYFTYEYMEEEKTFWGITNKKELVEENVSLLPDKSFKTIINSLEKENILKWKRKYKNRFIIFDGGCWELNIYFNNGKIRKIGGENKWPKNIEKVLCLLRQEEYKEIEPEEIMW